MKNRILNLGIIFLLIILLICGCRYAGLWLIKKDNIVHSDAIVILIGSVADRVLLSVDLFNQRMANKIIFMEGSTDAYKVLESKGYHITSTTENINEALIALGIPFDRILVLNGGVESTQDEALILRKYLETRSDIDTILLVSSAAHTRRASMIFKSAFRKSNPQINVVCAPNKYSKFNAEKWWKDKNSIQTVLFEYLKIANFIFIERRQLTQRNIINH
jgi:uncharacterized SAM-binding protein YcdF (DUF218 family)